MLPRLRSLVAAALATLTAALLVVWALPGRFPANQSLALHADLGGRSPMRHGDSLRRVLSLQIGPTGAIAREPTFRPRRGGSGILADVEFAPVRPAASPPLVRLASLSSVPAFEPPRLAPPMTQLTLQRAVFGPAVELRPAAVRFARLADPEHAPEIERKDGLPVVVASDVAEPAPDQTGAVPAEPAVSAPAEPVEAVEPPGARPAPAKAPWPRRAPRTAATSPAKAQAAKAAQKARAQKAARASARNAAKPRPASQQQQFFPYYDGSQTQQARPRARARSAPRQQRSQPQAETPWWNSQSQ